MNATRAILDAWELLPAEEQEAVLTYMEQHPPEMSDAVTKAVNAWIALTDEEVTKFNARLFDEL